MKNLARKMFLLIGFALVGTAIAPAVANAQPRDGYWDRHHRWHHYRHHHYDRRYDHRY